MSTGFFCKIIKRISILCVCVVIAFVGAYAINLSKCEYLTLESNCYFLCVDEGGAEACATQVAIDGGAGYLWKEKVVLGAYFSEQEIVAVARKVKEKYPSVVIEKLYSDEVLLPLETKDRAKSMLGNLHNHISSLADVARDLEEGLSQEKAKSRLRAIYTGFTSLAKVYPLKRVQELCDIAKSWIQSKTQGVIFANELRYCVCELAVAFHKVVKGESL